MLSRKANPVIMRRALACLYKSQEQLTTTEISEVIGYGMLSVAAALHALTSIGAIDVEYRAKNSGNRLQPVYRSRGLPMDIREYDDAFNEFGNRITSARPSLTDYDEGIS